MIRIDLLVKLVLLLLGFWIFLALLAVAVGFGFISAGAASTIAAGVAIVLGVWVFFVDARQNNGRRK